MNTDSMMMENAPPTKQPNQSSRLSIEKLLITDSELITNPLKHYLASTLGLQVHIATHAVDIITLLNKEKFDAVLLDLSIPNIHPFKLINLITMSNLESKVIIVYDNSTLEMAIEIMSKGSFELLKKPYDISRLVELLVEPGELPTTDNTPAIEYEGMDDTVPLREEEKEEEYEGASYAETEDQPDVYKYIIENTHDVVYTTDNNGIFTFANSRVETLLGFETEDLIGKHYSVLVYHEDIDEANKLFYDKLNTRVEPKSYELRLRCRKGNGEPVLFDMRTIPFPVSLMNESGPVRVEADSQNGNSGTCCVARDITDRKRVEEMISHNAHHDYLTGLPDRILINDRIDAAIAQSKRSTKKFAVLFLDLNGFKDVNDTYGHSMGDALLQAVSSRIKGCIREVDTLARVGGDEFMLLVSQIDEQSGVNKIVEKIIHEIEKPYNLVGRKMSLSASVGIAMYPDDGETKEMLISSSDMAMYQEKRNRKKEYQLPPEI